MSHFIRNSILHFSFNCMTALMLFTGVVTAHADQKSEGFASGALLQSLISSGNFTLPSFDPSLGTLETMTLTFSVSYTSLQTVYNSSGRAVGFQNISVPLNGTVIAPGQLVLNAVAPRLATSVSSGTGKGPGGIVNNFLPTPREVKLNPTTDTTDVTTLNITDPNVLALYEGTATSPVDLSYFADASGISIPNLGVNSSAFKGTCKVAVNYTFDASPLAATPEPPGKYLAAIVAVGMTLMLIRRRSWLRA